MLSLVRQLGTDEAGYIISAELVLVASIVVLSMVVGLAEVSFAVNGELQDVADAYDSVNNDSGGRYGNDFESTGFEGEGDGGGDIYGDSQ